jgi:diguanylate cyclase (GGDEF)-like protein
MKMLCSSPSVPQIKAKLLADITHALNADGGRLLILAKPLARRAQILSYGLQPLTAIPIEKNLVWQDILYTEATIDRASSPTACPQTGIFSSTPASEVAGQSGWNQSASEDATTTELVARVYPIDRIAAQPQLAPLLTHFSAAGIHSLLILPLRYNRQCVGCLTLFRATPDLRWTDADLKLAQNLAIEMYLVAIQQQVAQMSGERVYYDVLTGLPHRVLLAQSLTLALAKMPAVGEVLAVVFLGLDRFKQINDSIGYRVGDRLLQLIAERLKNTLGTQAIVGRWSGDEFALFVPALSDINTVNEVAERVLNCFDLPFVFDRDFQNLKTNSLYIKASMGIAIAIGSGQDSETLLKHADAALDLAKNNGRNHYEIYTGNIARSTPDRLQLENMLDGVCAALAGRSIANTDGKPFDARQLLLHYQPQLDIHTGEIIGIEALLRCQDRSANLINPADFIPIAEATGSILPMGEWVIRTACKQKKLWQEMGLGDFPIAVNFSVKQLQSRRLIDTITDILAETGLSPTALEVEITESIAIKDLDLAISILESLREIGVKISLDDFGTGYSSLAALKYLPLDRLKIDRSFIRELRANTVDAGIVKTIVNLGHELNLNVVAEGVETVEQLEFLRSINCDTVQGFLFGRPLPASELETTIAQGSYWNRYRSHYHN